MSIRYSLVTELYIEDSTCILTIDLHYSQYAFFDGDVMLSYNWDSRVKPSELYIIIGNGFDIECGLPTSYTDFLDKVRNTIKIYDILRCYRPRTLCRTWIKQGAKNIESYLSLRNNYWYNHFVEMKKLNNWVDFEEEVFRIVTKIEDSAVNTHQSQNPFLDDKLVLTKKGDLCKDLFNVLEMEQCKPLLLNRINLFSKTTKYSITYRQLYDVLFNDLKSVVDVLNNYLCYNLNQRRPRITKCITEVIEEARRFDRVYAISFNYSSTLQQIFKANGIPLEVCYVHGKLSSDTSRHSIVLGIDDRSGSEDIDYGFRFAKFRKDNQRATKGTDTSYKDKILSFENKDTSCVLREVIIFGHSLAKNDSSIIAPFLKAPNTRTRIYYYDNASWSSLYENLRSDRYLGNSYEELEKEHIIEHWSTVGS